MLDTGSKPDDPYMSNNTPTGELKKRSRNPNMDGIQDILLSESSASWCSRQYVLKRPMALSRPYVATVRQKEPHNVSHGLNPRSTTHYPGGCLGVVLASQADRIGHPCGLGVSATVLLGRVAVQGM